MAETAGQLGQLRPADTTAASLYSPAASVSARLTRMTVCNNTGGAVTCRIFLDDDGSTYDEDSAIYYDKSVPANDTLPVEEIRGVYMNNSAGNLAVRSATGDALNFMVWGIELS